MDTPYQTTFTMLSPAVYFAGGHGLCTTDIDEIPGLSDFIHRKTSTFDLENLPEDFPKRPLSNPIGMDHLYFCYILGWLWRIFGVNAQVLFYLTVAMRLLCALSVYGLFRLGLSRIVAFWTVLVIFTGPAFLYLDISARDMGKAPFIISAITVCAWLAIRSHSPARMILISLLLGTGLGIGYGVRPDTVIALPAAIFTTAFLAQISSSRVIPWRILGTFLLLASFSLLTQPITRTSALEGNHRLSVHVVGIGMLKSIENNLLPSHQPYSLMPDSLTGDAPTLALTAVLGQRLDNSESMINVSSAEYEYFSGERNTFPFVDPFLFYNGVTYSKIGRIFLFRLLEYFPADFLLRAWRATAVLFHLDHAHMQFMPDRSEIHGGWLKWLITAQHYFTLHISRWGVAYFIVAFFGLAAVNLRTAFVAAVFFLWFAGYPSLQYEYRHAFYLVFIPVMALAFLLEYSIRIIRQLFKSRAKHFSKTKIRVYGKRILITLVCILSLYFFPMAGLRVYQHIKVKGLAQSIADSPKSPVSLKLSHEDGRIFVVPAHPLERLDRRASLLSGEVAWTYGSLIFDSFGRDIPLTIHYDRRSLLYDFTHHQILEGCTDNHNGRIAFYFPIIETDSTYSMDMLPQLLRTYPAIAEQVNNEMTPLSEQHWWRRGKFLRISFPEEFLPAFRGFNEVTPDSSVPLLPFLTVPENRTCLQSHKQGPWESAVKAWKKKRSLQALSFESAGVWKIEEEHLPSPAFESFPTPLLPADSLQSLVRQWQGILLSCPDLKETASRDLLNYADRLQGEGKTELVMEACKTAEDWTLSNPLPAMRQGELYEERGLTEEAIDAYGRALSLHPYLPITADRVDTLISEYQNPERALDLWKKVFDAHPEDLFSGMRLALHYEKASLYDSALAVFMEVHKQHPDNPDARLSLVRCLVRTQRPEEALELLKSVLICEPRYTLLVTQHAASQAELLSSRKEYQAAAGFWEYLATLESLNLEHLLGLAFAYRESGFLEASRDTLQKGLALAEESGSPEAPDIAQLLSDLEDEMVKKQAFMQ
ncbi:MAG: tetratricopeptide repeat protein [Candidatus Hydrogenedens sp.]|nr:tetratricopeptide repeat protein [Candidatus Hydrogenedens sp.]